MKIIPAIDIKNGNCIRLVKGNFTTETIYSNDPLMIAKKWESLGFSKIHVVDLDGARTGIMKNKDIIKKIIKKIRIPIQVGGGIRDQKTIEELLDCGVENVILGTRAILDKEWLFEIVKEFKEKIIVAVDENEGTLAIKGWEEKTSLSIDAFIDYLVDLQVKKIIYTDVSKDGTLSKPIFSKYKEVNKKINVIASGGVSSIEDIKTLSKNNVLEVIVGKALYENKIDLKEAKKYVS